MRWGVLALLLWAAGAEARPSPRVRVTARARGQTASYAFDFDGNIAWLDTHIYVRPRGGGPFSALSQKQWALHGADVGKRGRYRNFEVDDDERTGSFREFRDLATPRRNVIRKHLLAALAKPPAQWQGLSFSAFVQALSNPETARKTTIITARGHSPARVREALRELQRRGYIEYLPPLENIFPVTWSGTRLAGSPAERKTAIMSMLLDEVQATRLGRRALPVITPDGQGRRPMHLWGFSDDTYENFAKAVSVLSGEVQKGRWPDVKITVFFTGRGDRRHPPHAVILTPDGKTRAPLPGELGEAQRVAFGYDSPR